MYVLALEECPEYLLARITGERTPQNLLRYLEEAFAATAASGRSKVLLEMHFKGATLSSASIVNVISLVVGDALRLAKVAIVEPSPDPGMGFAETVALNRGVNARVFTTLSAAQQWLAEPPSGKENAR
jgi:hypothetical protein